MCVGFRATSMILSVHSALLRWNKGGMIILDVELTAVVLLATLFAVFLWLVRSGMTFQSPFFFLDVWHETRQKNSREIQWKHNKCRNLFIFSFLLIQYDFFFRLEKILLLVAEMYSVSLGLTNLSSVSTTGYAMDKMVHSSRREGLRRSTRRCVCFLMCSYRRLICQKSSDWCQHLTCVVKINKCARPENVICRPKWPPRTQTSSQPRFYDFKVVVVFLLQSRTKVGVSAYDTSFIL